MKRELREKLKELEISVVYLFGSRITGGITRLSDVDIGVVLKGSPSDKDTRTLYTALFEMLSDLYHGPKLDIVFLQDAPLSLQYSAIKGGRILFEEDPVLTAEYEYRVVTEYLDFRPVLDLFDQVQSERYAAT